MPLQEEIVASIAEEGVTAVTMHDGSIVRFRSVPEGYDPTDRQKVLDYLSGKQTSGEIVTGLLFLDEHIPGLHEQNNTSETPLSQLPYQELCPGSEQLARLQDEFR